MRYPRCFFEEKINFFASSWTFFWVICLCMIYPRWPTDIRRGNIEDLPEKTEYIWFCANLGAAFIAVFSRNHLLMSFRRPKGGRISCTSTLCTRDSSLRSEWQNGYNYPIHWKICAICGWNIDGYPNNPPPHKTKKSRSWLSPGSGSSS